MNKNLENLTCHSFTPKPLVVFISYTWLDDNDANHGTWVNYFVNKLELVGVKVKYDKRTAGNSQTREFMEDGVNNSDFVICICSDKYVERFNKEGDYTIPDSVVSISEEAFNDLSGLTGLVIPEGVTSIGECVFNECDNLTSVSIPSSVTSINKSAFSFSGLESVSIPSSVTSIGDYAFTRLQKPGERDH